VHALLGTRLSIGRPRLSVVGVEGRKAKSQFVEESCWDEVDSISKADSVVNHDPYKVSRRLERLLPLEHHRCLEREEKVGDLLVRVVLVLSELVHRRRSVDADEDGVSAEVPILDTARLGEMSSWRGERRKAREKERERQTSSSSSSSSSSSQV
jgi:hypothetical protein